MSIETTIAALIRKAERTKFEAEADVFMAKAQELMVKHAIDIAAIEVVTGERKEEISIQEFHLPAMLGRDDRVSLFCNIARTFGCKGWHRKPHRKSSGGMTGGSVFVAGYASDILNIATLWHTLCIQLDITYRVSIDNGDNV